MKKYEFSVNGKKHTMDEIREMNDEDLYWFLYDVHLEGYFEGSSEDNEEEFS